MRKTRKLFLTARELAFEGLGRILGVIPRYRHMTICIA